MNTKSKQALHLVKRQKKRGTNNQKKNNSELLDLWQFCEIWN
jgi:hypothetical protein